MDELTLSSPIFKNKEFIPPRFTCDGENINPVLNISGVPKNCQSLVLIVDDPDAPGGNFVHWVVWNINPETKEIKENSVPEGTKEGLTDFGRPGYGGPCPPSGTHRYFFRLFALDQKLEASAEANKSTIENLMKGHILEQIQFIGLYSRQA